MAGRCQHSCRHPRSQEQIGFGELVESGSRIADCVLDVLGPINEVRTLEVLPVRRSLTAFMTLLLVLATLGCGGTSRSVQQRNGDWTVFRAPARNASTGATRSRQCNANDTQRTMRVAEPRFLRCYELALTDNRWLHGGLTVEWMQDSEDQVTKVRIAESTLGHTGVEQCVLDVVGDLDFPMHEGICVVRYPILFQPGE